MLIPFHFPIRHIQIYYFHPYSKDTSFQRTIPISLCTIPTWPFLVDCKDRDTEGSVLFGTSIRHYPWCKLAPQSCWSSSSCTPSNIWWPFHSCSAPSNSPSSMPDRWPSAWSVQFGVWNCNCQWVSDNLNAMIKSYPLWLIGYESTYDLGQSLCSLNHSCVKFSARSAAWKLYPAKAVMAKFCPANLNSRVFRHLSCAKMHFRALKDAMWANSSSHTRVGIRAACGKPCFPQAISARSSLCFFRRRFFIRASIFTNFGSWPHALPNCVGALQATCGPRLHRDWSQ